MEIPRRLGPSWRGHESARAYLFILPFFFFLSLFWLYPVAMLVLDSLHKWDGMSPDRLFVGLDNYSDLLVDEDFLQSLGNSFLFIAGSVPLGIALSLGLALLLRKKIAGLGFFRTAFFLPVATSLVATGLIWQWFLNDNFGVLNGVLGAWGAGKIPWLTSTTFSMISVILMTLWKDAGYFMIIFLVGLHSIDESYYEAAKIDGASRGVIFRQITWPLLMPITFLVLVTKIIFSFRAFEQIYALTKGGPVGSTKVFVYYIWEEAFKLGKVGYAAAAALILLLVVLVITGLQFKFIRRRSGT